MAVVRVDLEVSDKGTGQVIQNVGGQLKGLGAEGIKAGAAIGAGFAIAEKALEVALDLLKSIPAEISRVISTASGLADLAAKTQMTTDSLQRLKYAGSLVGVTLEDISAAALKAQRNLIENPKAFDKWGLSAKALRDLKPEEQLAAIADVIRQIPEPAKQVAAAMDLMGKGGAANMALLRSDLHQVLAEADDLGVTMGDELVGHLDDVDDATTRLEASWTALKDKLVGGVVAATGADQFMNDLAQAIGAVNLKAKDGISPLGLWVQIVERFTGLSQLKDFVALLSLSNVGSPAPKMKPLDTSPDQIDFDAMLKDAVKLTEDLAKADDKAAAAAKRHAEQQRKLAEALQAKQLKQYTLDIQEEFNRILKLEQETAEQQDRNTDAFVADVRRETEAYQKWVDQRKKGEADVAAAWEREQRRMFEEQNQALFDMGAAFSAFGDLVGGTFGKAVSFLGGMIQQAAQFASALYNARNAWEAIAVAIQAAADIYNKGFQSKSPGKGAASGAAQGAALGTAVLPGWGTLIGAGVGATLGFIGGKRGQAAELKELRAEFEALEAQARKAGVVLNQTFNPSNAKQYKAAIDEVKKALDTNAEAQEKLHDALSRYNFTLAEQGPILAAQELDQKFGQIYQDWMLLTKAGVDHNAVMRELGPSVGTYVDAAVAAGTEIPIAMKPIIDDLYTHGKLLHENGEAYTEAEYNGLSYAQTMSQMFTDLIKHVEELVAAIRGVPDKTATITVRTVRTGGGPGDPGDPGDPGNSQVPEHASGLFMPSASSDGWLGYHRGERISITPAANSAARNAQDRGDGGGGPSTIVIPITVPLTGQQLDVVIERRGRAGFIRVK